MVRKSVLVFIGIISLVWVLQSLSAAAESQRAVVTPPTGSAERKVILDTLREEIQKLHGIDAIFVVRYLKMLNGWVWIETLPKSPDGTSQYEDISALLQKKGTKWTVAEIACSEEDNEECLGSPDYFKGLKKRFPAMPPEILPR
jgi:hypothetical protein